ncbi:MAG: hypothetical protein JRG88_11075 [Deltaproteobacteria bacterium]|nr:hypothetical protein [Deltaproteobacteria bacterium]
MSPRTLVDQYYSVQVTVDKETPIYQFKLRDTSEGGLCIAVRRDSDILSRLEVGQVHRMRYAPSGVRGELKYILTKIRHITLCREGPHKDHYLVGLTVVDHETPA